MSGFLLFYFCFTFSSLCPLPFLLIAHTSGWYCGRRVLTLCSLPDHNISSSPSETPNWDKPDPVSGIWTSYPSDPLVLFRQMLNQLSFASKRLVFLPESCETAANRLGFHSSSSKPSPSRASPVSSRFICSHAASVMCKYQLVQGEVKRFDAVSVIRCGLHVDWVITLTFKALHSPAVCKYTPLSEGLFTASRNYPVESGWAGPLVQV